MGFGDLGLQALLKCEGTHRVEADCSQHLPAWGPGAALPSCRPSPAPRQRGSVPFAREATNVKCQGTEDPAAPSERSSPSFEADRAGSRGERREGSSPCSQRCAGEVDQTQTGAQTRAETARAGGAGSSAAADRGSLSFQIILDPLASGRGGGRQGTAQELNSHLPSAVQGPNHCTLRSCRRNPGSPVVRKQSHLPLAFRHHGRKIFIK